MMKRNQKIKLFIVLYVALVAGPDSERVQPLVKQTNGYIHCLQLIDTPKNPEYNFVHQECKIVQMELPGVSPVPKELPKID